MSIAEAGNITLGFLVPDQIWDEDNWNVIMDVSIIDGLICCYTEIDDYAGLMIDNKKEEEWELVELEIGDIYKERSMWKYAEEYTEY